MIAPAHYSGDGFENKNSLENIMLNEHYKMKMPMNYNIHRK